MTGTAPRPKRGPEGRPETRKTVSKFDREWLQSPHEGEPPCYVYEGGTSKPRDTRKRECRVGLEARYPAAQQDESEALKPSWANPGRS
ncbi:hypothetical protein CSHISOI_02379 [Colletotrichum shisoi]|uniref:Uncharacterized protein n=1 Tax=Colletotrichum shisoi TaxID=2078593 RepID=A0A5Q4C1A4_9PEZI|nr:hypothetical protein CSHISOI_02379 [Colletotrichum shisoi]